MNSTAHTPCTCWPDRRTDVKQEAATGSRTRAREPLQGPAADADSIYKIPAALHGEGLDDIVLRKLDVTAPAADLSTWNRLTTALANPEHTVDIAMVG